ncbi:MAG: hypothetical protein J6T91_02165 [Alphaproteobacteria bacterium]|nr:hypothetical protein [Alphaproteobacteria bacterium]
MFLLVNPNGNKCWHLKYKYCKKTETGIIRGVSRGIFERNKKKRNEVKIKISRNVDPVQEKKFLKNELKENTVNTFENIALIVSSQKTCYTESKEVIDVGVSSHIVEKENIS